MTILKRGHQKKKKIKLDSLTAEIMGWKKVLNVVNKS